MGRNVRKGRVIVEKKYAVEIKGKRYYVPKGCEAVKPQLEAIAGKEVEVLLAGREVLAIRISKEAAARLKIPPIITCYLWPPDIVFAPDIMEKIQPIITESLVESKLLDADVAKQLQAWQQESV